MFVEAMKNYEDGNFGNTCHPADLSNGGVSMGTFSDALVSADQQEEFAEYAEKIAAGALV